MFTINAVYKDKCLPLVYGLLPDKSTQSYKRFFEIVLVHTKTKPKSVSVDFEVAIINAVLESIKGVKIDGCYFHYASNLFKHCQSNHLLAPSNPDYKTHMKSFYQLKSLAFVPAGNVIMAFEAIKQASSPKFEPIVEYFEKYYIGKKANPDDPKSKERQVPLFPIKSWNVYTRTLREEGRTNNLVEAWHKVFAQTIKRSPCINERVQQF